MLAATMARALFPQSAVIVKRKKKSEQETDGSVVES